MGAAGERAPQELPTNNIHSIGSSSHFGGQPASPARRPICMDRHSRGKDKQAAQRQARHPLHRSTEQGLREWFGMKDSHLYPLYRLFSAVRGLRSDGWHGKCCIERGRVSPRSPHESADVKPSRISGSLGRANVGTRKSKAQAPTARDCTAADRVTGKDTSPHKGEVRSN